MTDFATASCFPIQDQRGRIIASADGFSTRRTKYLNSRKQRFSKGTRTVWAGTGDARSENTKR